MDRTPLSILIVDDEPRIRSVLERHLDAIGHRPRMAESGEAGLRALRLAPADLVILDINMPGIDGIAMLRQMRALGSTAEVVVASAFLDVPRAVAAFRHGACDLVEKPYTLARIDEALEVVRGRLELRLAGTAPAPPAAAVRFIGGSSAAIAVREIVSRVGPTDSTVLIEGEQEQAVPEPAVVRLGVNWGAELVEIHHRRCRNTPQLMPRASRSRTTAALRSLSSSPLGPRRGWDAERSGPSK